MDGQTDGHIYRTPLLYGHNMIPFAFGPKKLWQYATACI